MMNDEKAFVARTVNPPIDAQSVPEEEGRKREIGNDRTKGSRRKNAPAIALNPTSTKTNSSAHLVRLAQPSPPIPTVQTAQ